MSESLSPRALARLRELGRPLLEGVDEMPETLGRYRVLREIGRGGMGVVYEAWDPALVRRVAIKTLGGQTGLGRSARERFAREARAAARLAHPNIAAVYDATADWIAMELVEGRTLAELGRMDCREALQVMRDAALAIQFAHDNGLVHRDLKPSNIMVSRDVNGRILRVYVMDFGLALDIAVDATASQSGTVIGTPAWMSPEQARGERAGPATDVHALGATLFFVLSGHPPFEGEDVYELIRRVVDEEPRALAELVPGVDRDLAIITECAMRKEAARRYPSARAFAEDLERWLAGRPILARPARLGYRLKKAIGRSRQAMKLAAAAVVLVLLVVVPFLLFNLERRRVAESALNLYGEVTAALADADGMLRSGQTDRRRVGLEACLQRCDRFLETAKIGSVQLFRGRILRALERNDEALAAFDDAVLLSPDLAAARFERGLLLGERWAERSASQRRTDELDALRERAKEDLEAGLPRVRSYEEKDRSFGIGLLAWLKGDAPTAITRLKETIENDPVHFRAHLVLAHVYFAIGDQTQGLRYTLRGTEVMRGMAFAYEARRRGESQGPAPAERAEPLLVPGIEGLVADFSERLLARPSESLAFGQRGQSRLREAGRAVLAHDAPAALDALGAASTDFSSAITLGGESGAALVDRAICEIHREPLLQEVGRHADARQARATALADLSRALELDAQDPCALAARGFLRRRDARGTRSETVARLARADLSQALENLSPFHEGRSALEQAIVSLGEWIADPGIPDRLP